MSYSNKQPVSNKPFCKVCQDAGKPESVYTSHFVRSMPDRSGKTTVICPTLLATECRFCLKLGHTTKFCPVIAANKKSEEKINRKNEFKQIEAKSIVKIQKPKSVFAALADSDSDEEDCKVSNKVSNIKQDFPSLGTETKIQEKQIQEKPAIGGWAAIAAKTVTQYETEKYEQKLISDSIKRQMPPIKKAIVVPQVQKSWADCDSEEEFEEAYEKAYVQATAKPTYRTDFNVAEMDWAAADSDSDEDW
jgi:hypothetical protein